MRMLFTKFGKYEKFTERRTSGGTDGWTTNFWSSELKTKLIYHGKVR